MSAHLKCNGVVIGAPSELQMETAERLLSDRTLAEQWLVFWRASGKDTGKQAHHDPDGNWEFAVCGVALPETTRVIDWLDSEGTLADAMRRDLQFMICEKCAGAKQGDGNQTNEDIPPGHAAILVRTIVRLLTCDGCGKEQDTTPMGIQMNYQTNVMECKSYSDPCGWSTVHYADANQSSSKNYCRDCRPAMQRALDALPQISKKENQ